MCWQQLVQTVQGEFWVRATQEGNQPVVQVLVASSATQSNTGGEPASYKCCNSLRKAAARNTEKRSEQKRKRTMLDQRPESVWPGVVCWPF